MLTAVKLKNRISKLNLSSANPVAMEYINLQNVRINGETRGCSGFIKNLANNVIVYVNTESIPCLGNKIMYRYALHDKDYRGCMNHWATENDFAEFVYKALFDINNYNREKDSRW